MVRPHAVGFGTNDRASLKIFYSLTHTHSCTSVKSVRPTLEISLSFKYKK